MESFVEILRIGLLAFLAQLNERYGDVARFELAGVGHYLVSRPEHVRAVFVEHLDRLSKPEFLRQSNRGHWGDGLTSLESEAWRERRALVHEALRRHDPERHRRIIAAATAQMLDGWRRGRVIALRDELRTLTARIAARMIFDAEVEGPWSACAPDESAGTIRQMDAIGEDIVTFMVAPGVTPLSFTRPRAPRDMSSTIALVEARLRRHERRGDVLSLLIEVMGERGVDIGQAALADELIQMLYAGHHTLPETLIHVSHMLAHEPAGASVRTGAAGASTVDEAKGLQMFVRETMRMYPPAPILYRQLDEGLELDGYELEPGAGIWVSPWLLHRDPRNFSDPHTFKPERFARDTGPGVPRFAYLPFGAGPRTCVANRSALLQMCEICRLVLQRYELSPVRADPSSQHFVVSAVAGDGARLRP